MLVKAVKIAQAVLTITPVWPRPALVLPTQY